MQSTTNYKSGDVLLIPFPFTDLSSQKKRPSLVISSAEFNSAHFDIIVAAITSQIPKELSAWEYRLSEKNKLLAGCLNPRWLSLERL